MDWDSIIGIAEVIGTLVVVISLGYVGVQIRQNTNLAAGESQRELMNSFQSQLDRIIEKPELVRRGLNGLGELTDSEKFEFSFIFNQFLNQLEQPLRMLERGLETQDNVDMYGNICVAFLQAPGAWEIWEQTREYYFPLSRAYIEARLRDPKSLPPSIIELYSWARISDEAKVSGPVSPPDKPTESDS